MKNIVKEAKYGTAKFVELESMEEVQDNFTGAEIIVMVNARVRTLAINKVNAGGTLAAKIKAVKASGNTALITELEKLLSSL